MSMRVTGPSNLLVSDFLFFYQWRVVTHNWFDFVNVCEVSEHNLSDCSLRVEHFLTSTMECFPGLGEFSAS